MQRGIGGKTTRELQEAVAAIKAQTTTMRLDACEPKPAKATSDNDASSIPDCLSDDGYSSDIHPATPDLVPASPTGLSTGTFEQDGAASSAFSDDEAPVPSEASLIREEILGDLEEFLPAQQSQVQ